MPSASFRIGVASVQIGIPNNVSVPAMTSIAVSATALTPTSLLVQDVKSPLTVGSTYSVMLGLVGLDTVNGGYTVTACSASSTPVTIASAGQVVYMQVPNANLPSGFTNAVCMAIFVKINSANFQLGGFAYIDPARDFNYALMANPLAASPTFATTLLQSTNSDPTLGSRSATGYNYLLLSPTTGGVNVARNVTNVNVSPDTGADFNVTTTRTAEISFQLLANDILQVVEGNAGDYVKMIGSNGIVEFAEMSLNTAQAVIPGNRPMKLVLPPDANGNQETRLYLGQLLINQSQNNEAWRKDSTTPISFTYSPASIDTLINNQHSELVYRVGG